MSYWSLIDEAISAWAVPGQVDTPDDYRGVNNATWVGTATYAEGPYGRCFDFNGVSSLNCGDVYSLSAAGSLTFFCRAQWRAAGAQFVGYLGGQSNGYLAGYSAKFEHNANAGGYVGSSDGASPSGISATSRGVWHNVIVRYDDSAGESRYRIGSEAETILGQANQTSAPEFWIGSRAGALTLDGLGAEYAVWNRFLSDSEEAELIAGPEPKALSPPSIAGQLVAGSTIQIAQGQWDAFGNGSNGVVTRLQSSADGATGWQDLPGSTGVSQYTLPTTLASHHVRVQSIATNLGGESDPAYSVNYLVAAAPEKLFASAQTVRVAGPGASSLRPTANAAAAAIFSS